jgi:HEPN domain-containing protein
VRASPADASHAESWADVVELALKGLLRASGLEPPRIHDVSALLVAERERLPAALHPEIGRLAAISRDLRRDRELVFYGAEDLTPSTFYSRDDADRARNGASETLRLVSPHIAR